MKSQTKPLTCRPLFATPAPDRRKYDFDEDAAQRAEAFFPTHLRHTKGKWAGQPFELLPWQREIVRELFGWMRPDGTRLYREAYIEVPRKSGKSSLAAGLALYLLFADKEEGAEVYSAAGDRNQAKIVFEIARGMIQRSSTLQRAALIRHNAIFFPKRTGRYQPVSAEAGLQHGLNASGVILDELHVQPNRELYDVLKTSMGARVQPLLVSITTAGVGQIGICWELHSQVEKLHKATITEEHFFGRIYAAASEDPWEKEATWRKANPSFGVTVGLDFFTREAKRAENSPAFQNTFRNLYLDQWTQQAVRYLDIAKWDACASAVDPTDLLGRRCFGGLDLANTTDIAALVLVFPPQEEGEPFHVLPHFWIPQENMRERYLRDRVNYPVWAEEELIEATPGDVVDYAYIRQRIVEWGAKYTILEIAYDPWNATQITQELSEEGFAMIEMRPGYKNMSPPTKELLRLVLSRRLAHGGNPVLRWMADNLTVEQDSLGNIRPAKEHQADRIDGMVALIMALDRATRHEEKPVPVLWPAIGGSYDRD